jgi:hypothetical protein
MFLSFCLLYNLFLGILLHRKSRSAGPHSAELLDLQPLHVSAHGVTQLTMSQPRRSCLHSENIYKKFEPWD